MLVIKQFASTKPIEVPLHTYAEEGHLDQFTIHAGDQQGVLKGARLDLVASLEVNGAHFLPASLTRVGKLDELSLLAKNVPASGFQEEQKLTTQVNLKDGRVLKLQTTVEPQRPKLTLINKRIQARPLCNSSRKPGRPAVGWPNLFLCEVCRYPRHFRTMKRSKSPAQMASFTPY